MFRINTDAFRKKMNKEEFANMQKTFGWFGYDPSYNEEQYNDIKHRVENGEEVTTEEECKYIFPMVFGRFDCKIDYDKAEILLLNLLNSVITFKPQLEKGYEFFSWSYEYALTVILLATVYAYKDEYIKSAYYFMKGLKTEAINLNLPYCDFIMHILSELNYLVVEDAKYTGCGFDVDNPMGSIGGGFLNARCALEVIPNMEGENGEVIVAKQGRAGLYGHLRRRGSTKSDKIPEMIDIYETYIIDKDFNIKRICFYFNGYVMGSKPYIRIANGFKMINNQTAMFYKVVKD